MQKKRTIHIQQRSQRLGTTKTTNGLANLYRCPTFSKSRAGQQCSQGLGGLKACYYFCCRVTWLNPPRIKPEWILKFHALSNQLFLQCLLASYSLTICAILLCLISFPHGKPTISSFSPFEILRTSNCPCIFALQIRVVIIFLSELCHA